MPVSWRPYPPSVVSGRACRMRTRPTNVDTSSLRGRRHREYYDNVSRQAARAVPRTPVDGHVQEPSTSHRMFRRTESPRTRIVMYLPAVSGQVSAEPIGAVVLPTPVPLTVTRWRPGS